MGAEQDVKEFISRKTNSYQSRDQSSKEEPATRAGGQGVLRPGVLGSWTSDPGDMEAWELDIRIRMAEKQRRYTEITRKLKRLQSLKSKKCDSPKKAESPRKRDTPKKGEPLAKLEASGKSYLFDKSNCGQRKREEKPGKTAAKSGVEKEQVLATGADSRALSSTAQDKLPPAANDMEEICNPKKPTIDKASSFTDAFHKFKKAYNAKNSTSDVEANLSKSSKPLSSPVVTPKPSKLAPFSNWAKAVASPSLTAVKLEPPSPCPEPPVSIKLEPQDEDVRSRDIVQPSY